MSIWKDRVQNKKDDSIITQKNKPLPLVTAQDVSIFCHQISLILNSDVPLLVGMQDMTKDLHSDEQNPDNMAVLQQVADALESQETLSCALKSTGAFPHYMVGMVEIGEKCGTLDKIMEELAFFYEREDRLRQSIINAIGYPLFLIFMMTIIMTVLVWKIIPIFRQVVESFSSSSGIFAMRVMNAGEVLGVVSLTISVLLLAMVITAYIRICRNKFSGILRSTFGKASFIRKVSQKMALSRFASVLYTMFVSGYRVEEALDLSLEVLEDEDTSERIRICQQQLDEGASFADALGNAKVFTGIYLRMVAVGFNTGNVDKVMMRLSKIYAQDAEDGIDKIVSLIEPILVGTLSLLIGAILLSVMLPLVGVMTAIG